MQLSKLFAFGALVIGTSFSALACSASTDSSPTDEETDQGQDSEELRASYTSCNSDNDCVAISEGGCCPNGRNVAVNKNKVHAYQSSHACKQNPHPVCPLYVILDRRVAECNVGKHKCEMVAPEDIACGGFTMNPHKCPDGYSCDFKGHVPDVPGKCVQDPTPPPPPAQDCRANGCGAGKYCSFCWGSFACIPNGAMC